MLREEFEVFNRYVYFNWASVGDPPKRSVKAIENYLEELKNRPEDLCSSTYYTEIIDNIKKNLIKIVKSKKENIGIVGNSTTPAIQTAMNSIKLEKGDEIIVFDLDFPTVYAESLKWKEKGINIRVIKNKNGFYDEDEVISEINNKTKVILTSSVFWVNGFKLDLNKIGKAIHDYDGFIVVDAIQHIGQEYFNTDNIDFIAFGTQKWLLSPFSLGILIVNDRALELTNPPNYGYLNLDVGMPWDQFWEDANKIPLNNYKIRKGIAQSYEFGGFYSVPSLIGFIYSLELMNEIGIDKIRDHIFDLRKILIEGLNELNLEIISPIDEREGSGIITFKLYKDVQENYKIVEELNKKFLIKVSGRGAAGIGGIRVSIHFPNEEIDVLKLLDALKKLK